jgi:BirA family biotin operon repressor/biotin-[acetyl-CoA-carboxylase] ligase
VSAPPASDRAAVAFGRPRHHHRAVDSTNDGARALAGAGAPRGTVVTADEQSAGRGRHGRTWSAPPGRALLYSGILTELGPSQSLLPLAVPLAVCAAVESLAPVPCLVKWPNDVWAVAGEGGGRKLAGILIEARPPAWAVIGIGLNVAIADEEFPTDLRWPATSIGHGVAVGDALEAVNAALGRWVTAPPADVIAEYRRRDALEGREVSWEGAGDAGSGAGRAAGVDERGNLVVVAGDGRRLVLGAGEVSLDLGAEQSAA